MHGGRRRGHARPVGGGAKWRGRVGPPCFRQRRRHSLAAGSTPPGRRKLVEGGTNTIHWRMWMCAEMQALRSRHPVTIHTTRKQYYATKDRRPNISATKKCGTTRAARTCQLRRYSAKSAVDSSPSAMAWRAVTEPASSRHVSAIKSAVLVRSIRRPLYSPAPLFNF